MTAPVRRFGLWGRLRRAPGLGMLRGEGLRARVLRSSGFALAAFGGGRAMQLASTLILTRLLFPEAFGLMALVQVFVGLLEMFSDLGLRTNIIRSGRGDDPDFLDTAWTVQIARGALLLGGLCLLAAPVAAFYEEPLLAQMLPVVGLAALIRGFAPTKSITLERHLRLGREVWVNLAAQALALAATALLAWWLRSVWALVWGTVLGAAVQVALMHALLPGRSNRLRWERAAFAELFGFGKWIFLASIAGFFVNQADKLVLGRFIPLGELGLYHIALVLGSLPFQLASTAVQRVIYPLQRLLPTSGTDDERAKLFLARRLTIAATFAASLALVLVAVPLVGLLYDARYEATGAIVVLITITMLPRIVLRGYADALLSAGDARGFCAYLAAVGALKVALLVPLAALYGIAGALLAQAVSSVAFYPLLRRLLRPHRAIDAPADAAFALVAVAVGAIGLLVNWDSVAPVLAPILAGPGAP